MFNVPDSLYRLENITLIVWDVMSLQKLQIFALKRLSPMMCGLITNIFDDAIQMRMGHGKRPVAFLPGKMTPDPFPLVDVIRRPRLDIANQFRRRDVWF